VKIGKKFYTAIVIFVVVALMGSVFLGCKKEEKTGGTMRLYIHEPVSLDPPNSYESEGIQVIRQVWDGLVEYNPETLKVEPAVAESWDISDDGLVYTFHLKKGVKFHSGRELVADDFVYSCQGLRVRKLLHILHIIWTLFWATKNFRQVKEIHLRA
jgi:ABC-type transport system substrate-binding protein